MSDEVRQPSGAQIIPTNLAIRAMRDSGYRNTAYALAELIDNSVQAKAANIGVFCIEERRLINDRERRRIQEIAVIDDGKGMTPEQLCMALQFGNGSYLQDRSGIGRFGMGLPNSSISQCRRVDIWTWQAGPDNAMHSYLDLNEIESGTLREVPEPAAQPVPAQWRARTTEFIGTSGTLIVWQQFDEHRLSWRSARATLDNAEALVGRMYRKFIQSGTVRIQMVAMENEARTFDRQVRPNDPLYLATGTSTPPPFDAIPMFEPWGTTGEQVFDVPFNGKVHKVIVRLSLAKQESIPADGTDPGNKPYGRHAAKNIGVSILRAGRELDLDSGWAVGYDPRERWWGAEIEFPPELDEVFGVPNNKQAATVFSQLAHFEWDSEAEPDERRLAVIERLRVEGDPRAHLFEIEQYIRDQLTQIRERIKNQRKGRRSGGKRHDETSVDDVATAKFKQRAQGGHSTAGDGAPFDATAKTALVNDLTGKQYPPEAAKDIADAVEARGRKVIFVDAAFDGRAFFKVELVGAVTQVVFNTRHPAYDQLIQALSVDVEGANQQDLIARLHNASDTVKLIFAAWARFEMEDVPNRARSEDFREDWGRMARIFLQDE